MIKIYRFNYNFHEAECIFEVDTKKFTPKMAEETLYFFSWDEPVDPEEDPIDEVMKKCAILCIELGCANNWTKEGVQDHFIEKEGWFHLDGSHGVTLTALSNYEFSEEALDVLTTEKP